MNSNYLYLQFLNNLEEIIFDKLLDSSYMSLEANTFEIMHKNILKEINYIENNYTIL